MVRSERKEKKKPPTFQHLPANKGCFYHAEFTQTNRCIIAKKLKKTWINTKKIKSKWRAEKRKEGLVGGSTSMKERQQHSDDELEELSSENSKEDEDKEKVSTPSRRSTQTHRETNRTGHIPEAQRDDPVRNMMREAYSPSSLHTYKSDPLHRRGRGGGSQRGRASRGTNSSVGGMGRGRGQPNMKLRMGAMLEKIKRDCS